MDAQTWPFIAEIVSKVQSRELTATQLVEKALAAIVAHKEFNAIISTLEERARERAKEVDERIAGGETVGRLAGVPFIAKDNFLAFGGETTAASNILKGFKAPYQSTAIERLEAEGAICVAKANLDAFGHGSSTEHSDFMVTRNPHDKQRVPGGSSGGPAASVVLGMAPFALGTDTGGSNRQPASFSGCVGYKPTYGLVSRSGVVAMASSTDTIGPLARSVQDVSVVLDVIAGKDELDGTTIDRNDVSYTKLDINLAGKKIGVIREHMAEGLEEGVRLGVEQAIERLKTAGAIVKEISLPSLPLALACYYIIMPAEVSSNLSRYDGQHYGFSYPEARSLEDSYFWSRSKGFGKEAKRRIMIGTYVLSSGYYDAYYKRAQIVRTKLIKEFEAAFREVDFMLGPTAPTTAFKIGEKSQDPLQMYLADIMTVAPSLVGVPAISIPAGTSSGLPVGLQLIAPQKADRSLLALANKVEELLK